jgi:hypothetical protein
MHAVAPAGACVDAYYSVLARHAGAKLEYFDVYHANPRQHVRRSGLKLKSCREGNYVSWQNEDYEPSGWREDEMSFEWLLDDPEFQEYVYSDSEDSVSEDSSEEEDHAGIGGVCQGWRGRHPDRCVHRLASQALESMVV